MEEGALGSGGGCTCQLLLLAVAPSPAVAALGTGGGSRTGDGTPLRPCLPACLLFAAAALSSRRRGRCSSVQQQRQKQQDTDPRIPAPPDRRCLLSFCSHASPTPRPGRARPCPLCLPHSSLGSFPRGRSVHSAGVGRQMRQARHATDSSAAWPDSASAPPPPGSRAEVCRISQEWLPPDAPSCSPVISLETRTAGLPFHFALRPPPISRCLSPMQRRAWDARRHTRRAQGRAHPAAAMRPKHSSVDHARREWDAQAIASRRKALGPYRQIPAATLRL